MPQKPPPVPRHAPHVQAALAAGAQAKLPERASGGNRGGTEARPQVLQGFFLGGFPRLSPAQTKTIQPKAWGSAVQLPPTWTAWRASGPGQRLPEAVQRK